jgi:hypothetical protein
MQTYNVYQNGVLITTVQAKGINLARTAWLALVRVYPVQLYRARKYRTSIVAANSNPIVPCNSVSPPLHMPLPLQQYVAWSTSVSQGMPGYCSTHSARWGIGNNIRV